MLDRVNSKGLNAEEICSEETLLYHLISGLHTSVNMHVSSNYMDVDKNNTYANHDMYYEKIGNSPDRIKNMYFLYALLIRAVNRIHDQLIFNDYTTGLCERDDSLTIVHMTDLL
jgi:ERO1-like protein alpha